MVPGIFTSFINNLLPPDEAWSIFKVSVFVTTISTKWVPNKHWQGKQKEKFIRTALQETSASKSQCFLLSFMVRSHTYHRTSKSYEISNKHNHTIAHPKLISISTTNKILLHTMPKRGCGVHISANFRIAFFVRNIKGKQPNFDQAKQKMFINNYPPILYLHPCFHSKQHVS